MKINDMETFLLKEELEKAEKALLEQYKKAKNETPSLKYYLFSYDLKGGGKRTKEYRDIKDELSHIGGWHVAGSAWIIQVRFTHARLIDFLINKAGIFGTKDTLILTRITPNTIRARNTLEKAPQHFHADFVISNAGKKH